LRVGDFTLKYLQIDIESAQFLEFEEAANDSLGTVVYIVRGHVSDPLNEAMQESMIENLNFEENILETFSNLILGRGETCLRVDEEARRLGFKLARSRGLTDKKLVFYCERYGTPRTSSNIGIKNKPSKKNGKNQH
jgi:hypothetical protein